MAPLSFRIAFRLLLCLAAFFNSVSCSSQPFAQGSQHMIAAEFRNFSVGFSLQSSFGAAAIIVTGLDGALETHTAVHQGSIAYREVMARLSLDSSRHLAPPYGDDGEWWADWGRRAARAALMAVGLPASYEVGILADMVQNLRSQLEGKFDVRITRAVFTAAHLVALYRDDLQDTAAHLGIEYLRPRGEFNALVWETASAYAGHGLGLCNAWWNKTECWSEPMTEVLLFSVHYSEAALTVALSFITDASSLWEPDYRHSENFTLGREAMASYDDVGLYWRDVRRQLLVIMEKHPIFPKPELVILTGDAIGNEFIEHLEAALWGDIGRVPGILQGEPTVVAAKGAAEFARRASDLWWRD